MATRIHGGLCLVVDEGSSCLFDVALGGFERNTERRALPREPCLHARAQLHKENLLLVCLKQGNKFTHHAIVRCVVKKPHECEDHRGRVFQGQHLAKEPMAYLLDGLPVRRRAPTEHGRNRLDRQVIVKEAKARHLRQFMPHSRFAGCRRSKNTNEIGHWIVPVGASDV